MKNNHQIKYIECFIFAGLKSTMKKILVAITVLVVLAVYASTAQSTTGNMTFTVKTISNNTGYSPKHVLAIWIKDGQGNFVVSCKVMANIRKKHLVKWKSSSLENTTNAITGVTLSTHQTHTITWDGKDYSGNLMADGVYQVWVEYTSQNSASGQPAGPYMSLEFNKTAVSEHLAPANLTYFNNIVLDWVPDGVGIEEAASLNSRVLVYPNPFSENVKLQFDIDKQSQLQAYVVDQAGKMIAVLANEVVSAGGYELTWDGKNERNSKEPSGIYFIVLRVNGIYTSHKVLMMH